MQRRYLIVYCKSHTIYTYKNLNRLDASVLVEIQGSLIILCLPRSHGPWASQLRLQTTWEGAGSRRLVWIEAGDDKKHGAEGADKGHLYMRMSC